VVIAIALGGIGVYYYREVADFLGTIIVGVFGLGIVYAICQILCEVWRLFLFLFSWPIRKTMEGLKQIQSALDWTPGWVYLVLIAALGVADWFGALPFGTRDVRAWMNVPSANSSAPAGPVPSDAMPDR
jgi:hypothetical protein